MSTDLSASLATETVVDEVVVLVMVPFLLFPVVPLLVAVPVPVPVVVSAWTSTGACGLLLEVDVATSGTSSSAVAEDAASSSVVTIVVTVVVVVVTEGCPVDGVDPIEDINEANETAHQDEGAFTASGLLFSISLLGDDPPMSPSTLSSVSFSLPLFSGGDECDGVSELVGWWSCLLASLLCTVLNSLTVGSGMALRIVMSSFTCVGLAF